MSLETQCRICGSVKLHSILSLGRTPLANSLLTEAQLQATEPEFPLDVVFCEECSLVQITETVPPEQLFSHYLYFSSFSDTALQNAKSIAEKMLELAELNTKSLVIEIASNDGYLLQHYVNAGIPVLGIEPAHNIAKTAQEKGINTLCEFFSAEVAAKLVAEGILADVFHANNVLAHVANLNSVVAGINLILKPDGQAVIEAPYVKDLIDHTEFDTIYHEHLCYFSLTALDTLFRQHGLIIHDVERIPIHGGSLRIFVSKNKPISDRVKLLLEEENLWGVAQLAFYQKFGTKVAALKEQLVQLLSSLKAQNKTIAAYGASAKGSTLLNYCGIGKAFLDFVVDRSTIKQGYYTAGTHLPILAPEKLLAFKPDYVLLLTWNFADEILKQQAEYIQQGGRFIIPIPEVKII